MSYERPVPPAAVSPEFVDAIDELSAEELRAIAAYAEGLAEYRDRRDRLAEEEDQSKDEQPEDEDLPEEVPSSASVTVKEINDNKYYYWQWREGDSVKSKYKAPVDPDE